MSLEEKVLSTTKELIEKIGVSGDVQVKLEDESYYISISGDDVGVLVGYRGEVLESIQHILNLMLRSEEEFTRAILDIDNYREGRNKALEELAKVSSDKARFTGGPIELAPMSSYERRIIHLIVEEQEGVESSSVDTGEMRRVVITPTKAKEKE